MNFFYEALGDMEMGQLVDSTTAPNNIAIPWMNQSHLEKAIVFYQKAGMAEKRNRAEQTFRENKKKLVMLQFEIGNVADLPIIEYFEHLGKIARRGIEMAIGESFMPRSVSFSII